MKYCCYYDPATLTSFFYKTMFKATPSWPHETEVANCYAHHSTWSPPWHLSPVARNHRCIDRAFVSPQLGGYVPWQHPLPLDSTTSWPVTFPHMWMWNGQYWQKKEKRLHDSIFIAPILCFKHETTSPTSHSADHVLSSLKIRLVRIVNFMYEANSDLVK